MKYFKELDIDESRVENVRNSMINYLRSKYGHELKSIPISTSVIPFDEYCEYAPEILTLFDEYHIKPKAIILVVAYSSDHVRLHTDYVDPKRAHCRINIPILNCDDTYTEFYSGGVQNTRMMPNGYYASFIVEDDDHPVVFKDSIEIKLPTVIRVQEPHRVIINGTPVPRITISLFMDRDPVFLLDEE
jgi:hypothetical protein